ILPRGVVVGVAERERLCVGVRRERDAQGEGGSRVGFGRRDRLPGLLVDVVEDMEDDRGFGRRFVLVADGPNRPALGRGDDAAERLYAPKLPYGFLFGSGPLRGVAHLLRHVPRKGTKLDEEVARLRCVVVLDGDLQRRRLAGGDEAGAEGELQFVHDGLRHNVLLKSYSSEVRSSSRPSAATKGWSPKYLGSDGVTGVVASSVEGPRKCQRPLSLTGVGSATRSGCN